LRICSLNELEKQFYALEKSPNFSALEKVAPPPCDTAAVRHESQLGGRHGE
jgi:hypothetical protein